MKIRYKFNIYIAVFMLVTLLVMSSVWYRDTKKIMSDYLDVTAEELIKNAYSSFDYLLTETEYILTIIALNDEMVIEPLEKIIEEGKVNESSQFNQVELRNKLLIEDYISSLYGLKYYILGISVLSLDGQEYKSGFSQRSPEVLYDQVMAHNDINSHRGIIVLPPLESNQLNHEVKKNYVIPVSKVIRDKDGELLGFATMYFDYSIIDTLFSTNLPENSHFQVVDTSGSVIYSNKSDGEVYDVNHKDFIYSQFTDEKTGWAFMIGIPTDVLISELSDTMIRTWFSFGILFVVFLLGSMVLIKGMTNKINKLNQSMQEVATGNLEARSDIESSDEIGQMSHSFNHMVVRINGLVEEVKIEEGAKKEKEIDFLQAQINPHFISNTLNVIVWMADLYGANNIINLTKSLNALMRVVMKKGRNLITIEDELEHVTSYLKVMEYSNIYEIQVDIDADEDLKAYYIPSFTIQPFVENAIKHGLSESGHGLIEIKVKKLDKKLVISVRDDGKGMSDETLNHLDNERINDQTQISQIGIRNVKERIELLYGKDYGVEYSSELGRYTKATIQLPIIKEEDQSGRN